MADIKTIKGPMIFRPGISEAEKAAAVEALEKHFVGANKVCAAKRAPAQWRSFSNF
jgi:hypothetical protein